jgi:hypothetical protein
LSDLAAAFKLTAPASPTLLEAQKVCDHFLNNSTLTFTTNHHGLSTQLISKLLSVLLLLMELMHTQEQNQASTKMMPTVSIH